MKKLSMNSSGSRLVRLMIAMLLAAALTGCKKDDVHVYQVAAGTASPGGMSAGQPAPVAAGQPHLEWKLPPGWQEAVGDGVGLKGFTIAGTNGAVARVSITRMGNLAGKEAMLVNMWRGQAGWPALGDDEAARAVQPFEFMSSPGGWYEISGTNQNQLFQITTAFVHRPDASWFCKLSGDTALVAAQKPAFLEFLKSVKVTEAPVVADTASSPQFNLTTPAASSQYKWQVPAQWKTEAAGEMQVARFSLTGAGNAKADVFVSVFDNDTGGNLANVNRWRRQIGLGPIEEKDLSQLVVPLDRAFPGSVLVDLAGTDKRLVGVIVPRDGKFWFYKLVGDAAVVAPAKEGYVAFAKSKP